MSIVTILLSGTVLHAATQRIIVSEGSVITGIGGKIITGSDVINNGVFINDKNEILCTGTDQFITGKSAISFYDLTVAQGTMVTSLTEGQTVRGRILSDGTLAASGDIILISDAHGTALIDGSGTGSVTGEITTQRYLALGFGYKYISSPFNNATVSELSDDVNLNSTFPTVYKYDESRTGSGWVRYTNTLFRLEELAGYTVNLGNSLEPKIIDLKGTVNNGELTLDLFNHNNQYTKGFSLVGNPYPSPIDWDAEEGWMRTNVDNAVYFFNASTSDVYGGSYSTYIDGVSSDGVADNIIPAMQGFFVHVSGSPFPVSGSLSIDNKARVTNHNTVFLKSTKAAERSLVRLEAGYSDNTVSFDPFVIYHDDRATFSFDGQYDALKLFNTDAAVTNFYVYSTDSYSLSINGLPLSSDSTVTLKLGLKTEKNGDVIFKIRDIQGTMANKTITLFDVLTGARTTLNNGGRYVVNLTAGDYQGRFYLNISSIVMDVPAVTDDGESFTAYSSGGTLKTKIIIQEGTGGILRVFNLTGQQVLSREIKEPGIYEFSPKLTDGLIIVVFENASGRLTRKVFFSN